MIRRKRKIFSASGCLTAQAMNNYISGKLSEADKKSIEAHLDKCMVCSEALKGYTGYRKTSSMMSDIESLSTKIRKRYADRRKEDRMFPFIIMVSVILSLVIIIIAYYVIRHFLLET